MIMMYITPLALQNYLDGKDFSGVNERHMDRLITVMVPEEYIKQFTVSAGYIMFDVQGHEPAVKVNGSAVYGRGNYTIPSKG